MRQHFGHAVRATEGASMGVRRPVRRMPFAVVPAETSTRRVGRTLDLISHAAQDLPAESI